MVTSGQVIFSDQHSNCPSETIKFIDLLEWEKLALASRQIHFRCPDATPTLSHEILTSPIDMETRGEECCSRLSDYGSG